jgi:hypothetical protein
LDLRRVGQLFAALAVLALAAVTAVTFVAAAHRNGQVSALRNRGVPVRFAITGCRGLLGGSGSNVAGFSCTGSYRLGGHRYEEPLPGDSYYTPGTVLPAVAVPGDPALVTTAAILSGEHTSGKVYVLPAVLLAVLVLALAVVVLTARRARRPPLAPA